MYGFICKEGKYEWRVRRKEEGSSKVHIVREDIEGKRWSEYPVDYALSRWSKAPMEVKKVAKELKRLIPKKVI